MMKRTLVTALFSLLMVIANIPTAALADFYVIPVPVNRSPLSGPQQSICDFPYWQTDGHVDPAGFEVKYDLRFYDPDYFPSSQNEPNGGIGVGLFLGSFTSAVQRDAMANKISKLVFYNNDTGDYYEVRQAQKYDFLGNPSGDFQIWLTHPYKVLGIWDIVIVADGKNYAGSLTFTQEMLDRAPPLVVDPTVTYDNPTYTVTAPLTNGEQYRLRIFDEIGSLIWQGNMTPDYQSNIATISNIDGAYAGYTARIETRIFTGQWVAFMNYGDPGSCIANGGVSGAGYARSSIWFKIQVTQ